MGLSDTGIPVLPDERHGQTTKERHVPVCCAGTFEHGREGMAADGSCCDFANCRRQSCQYANAYRKPVESIAAHLRARSPGRRCRQPGDQQCSGGTAVWVYGEPVRTDHRR